MNDKNPSILHGDNFQPPEIEKWFEDESLGYYRLATKSDSYQYVYHELNKQHCFGFLEKRKYEKVLGIGSAYGYEFHPIIDLIGSLTIIDPADKFSSTSIKGVPTTYIKPRTTGEMEFEGEEFDLIVVFGALHHIPNVTLVLEECFRVLKVSGEMLIREPIVQMGDWRKPRVGLTKNERGLPQKYLYETINKVGFSIVNKRFCGVPVLMKLVKLSGLNIFSNSVLTFFDMVVSHLFLGLYDYYSRGWLSKLSPTSVCLVLKKPDTEDI